MTEWQPNDTLVSYDHENQRIVHSSIATGEEIRSFSLSDEIRTGDCITPSGLVRPFIDLSRAPLWRRILNTVTYWLRSFRDAT